MAKTNPTGVRIPQDKLNFIKGKEKLETVQKVVSFLVDKYWWEHKLQPEQTDGQEDKKKGDQPSLPQNQYMAFEREIIEAESDTKVNSIIAYIQSEKTLNASQKISLNRIAQEKLNSFKK